MAGLSVTAFGPILTTADLCPLQYIRNGPAACLRPASRFRAREGNPPLAQSRCALRNMRKDQGNWEPENTECDPANGNYALRRDADGSADSRGRGAVAAGRGNAGLRDSVPAGCEGGPADGAAPRVDKKLVEAAGIEPASASPLPQALHAYPLYCFNWQQPERQGPLTAIP